MFKRLAAVTLIGGAAFSTVTAAPAVAEERAENIQIIAIQTCRSVDIAGLGAAIHNILGTTYEHGPCINGSFADR
ncbi:hypothetical protein GCM10009678_55300 [Actinomadura kijaniata]|uniref:Uncharacterized protein n=1 Tax=Actinomadura namibiensis TaxID=182080 RepID=A0A7W3LLC3_ACTNM|nr:hypothetical protein [Actinomadura namibiensis]MBA8950253.1 hypothetical protein [Actinomadura namibiensis]